MDVKHGKMARADELDRTIVSRSCDGEGRELPGKSAFAEYAVGALYHLIKREAGLGEAAERCMEMAHEH
jgi:hypothetical protein